MPAHQTLNQHATASMQHRRHAEHGPNAGMVQERDDYGNQHMEGSAAVGGWARGGIVNDAKGGPQRPAREAREGWGRGGGKQGNVGSTEEVKARAGLAAWEVDTASGWHWGR